MRIFLDDSTRRTRIIKEKIDVVDIKTASACITVICDMMDEDTVIRTLFLDQDLEGEYQDSNESNCGMEVVRWLESKLLADKIERIIVHSHNSVAAEEMVDRLRRFGYNTWRVPFGVLQNILED